MDRSKQFREAAAQENEGRGRTGWRYSSELKSLAVTVVRDQRQAGVTWSEVAESLGVSALTLGRWLEEQPPAGFRRVEVVEPEAGHEEPSRPLSALTPNGLRLEGLSWAQALELARTIG